VRKFSEDLHNAFVDAARGMHQCRRAERSGGSIPHRSSRRRGRRIGKTVRYCSFFLE